VEGGGSLSLDLREQAPRAIDSPSRGLRKAGGSPAAAAGQEEADEEVVLRMGVDVATEHKNLGSEDVPDGHLNNGIRHRDNSSTKIGLEFERLDRMSGIGIRLWGGGHPGRPVRGFTDTNQGALTPIEQCDHPRGTNQASRMRVVAPALWAGDSTA